MRHEPVMVGRLIRWVEDAKRRIRLERIATRASLALVALAIAIGLGGSLSSGRASGAAQAKGALAPNPWTVYEDAVRRKIQERLDATWAKDRVPGKGKSLTLRIRLDTEGALDIVEVEDSSDSIAVDEFAMRTVRDVAPFGPVPPQARTQADTVTIKASFALH